MASLAIHIAIAKEYVKKHKGYDEEKFVKGTIAPDLAKDKRISHFYDESGEPDLQRFLKSYLIRNSYDFGYFLHLIVDRKFYIEYLNDWDNRKDANSEELYKDFNIITKEIVKKYNIKFPEEIEEYNIEKEGTLKYINKRTIIQFIDELSCMNLDDYIVENTERED